ncbi:hypothetical protein CC80DRAFT_594190 [Byssothecium circinans]|uniref:Uncharacterized protein n=1 Tax=Byssothecium circinans TaxID=147558 RepID=A0A6A5TVI4_9PLEO|nr:hypothetical protein CC80DRAFT_594190 [Byssothecium circinans]
MRFTSIIVAFVAAALAAPIAKPEDAIAYPESYKRDAEVAYPESYKRDAEVAYPESYKRDAEVAYPESYKRAANGNEVAYP